MIKRLGFLLTLMLLSFGIMSFSIFQTLKIPTITLNNDFIWLIRLPHVLGAFIAGGLLGLSGCLMQVLLRNPLADPYVLGISGGAGLITVLFLFLGFGQYAILGGAWLGSLLAILLLLISAPHQTNFRPEKLLLTGIALASGFSALMSLILFLSTDQTLREIFFWLIGDLHVSHIPIFPGCILLFGLLCSLSMAPELNLLTRGLLEAEALGANTRYLRFKLYLLSSLLTATAVALVGSLGFVGLIVPHVFRLLAGGDHRFLLPGCILLGGCLVTGADTLSRVLFFPQEPPLGLMMTLIGIPIFLILIRKNAA